MSDAWIPQPGDLDLTQDRCKVRLESAGGRRHILESWLDRMEE